MILRRDLEWFAPELSEDLQERTFVDVPRGHRVQPWALLQTPRVASDQEASGAPLAGR